VVVLALDTVSRAGSLALLRDGIVRDQVGEAGRTHGERLPGALLDLLSADGLAVADVDVFAVVAGPGSFTGLRVGIATVQGMALAARRSIVAVPTLEALVAAWRAGTAAPAPVVVACVDGQRGDVFFAAYEQASTAPLPRATWPVLIKPAVGRPEDLVDAARTALAGRRVALVGSGADRYASEVSRIADSSLQSTRTSLAAAAAQLAVVRLDDAVPPHGVRPLYIRRPDAVIARERRRTPAPDGLVVELAHGPDDLEAVESLQRSAFAEAWGTEAFARELANRDIARVYVMRDAAGSLVGYCACWLVAGELHINSLAVAEPWRRRRMATRLLEAVFDAARREGATAATLEVRESNQAARQLYERLGFRVEGVRRAYYQAPREDAIILWNRALGASR